ncbi:hypothetical protein [Halalkalicoccus tibetensis]|uniref:Glycine zipper domain-containing protein n=1 Tax=Halalkalicoccus tibetensis TaxID=175632 RepID=A0ABD5V6J8_9EURY
MIGSLAAGKKGAELGYKVYGVPGAVAAGAGGAAGMLVAKKGLEVAVETESSSIADDEGTRIEVTEIDGDDDPDPNSDPGPAGD